jgi:hypothetical protein
VTNQSPQREVLLAYLLGEATPDQTAEIDRVRGQPEVARALESLGRMLRDLPEVRDSEALLGVSEAQLARLRGLLPAREPSALERVAGRIREVVSTLVFDSFRAPELALGYRGGPSHRLVRYEWDGGAVDLRIAPDQSGDDRYWLTGDVRGVQGGAGGGGGVVATLSVTERVTGASTRTQPGADGSFELCVEPGEYEMRIESAESSVVVSLPRVGGGVE